MSEPMPPMSYSYPTTDDAVATAVVIHLRNHDERFRGDSFRARRRVKKAKSDARRILRWWEKEGRAAYESAATSEGYQSGVVTTLLLTLFGQWLAGVLATWITDLVKDALIPWLSSNAAVHYNAACMSRRAA